MVQIVGKGREDHGCLCVRGIVEQSIEGLVDHRSQVIRQTRSLLVVVHLHHSSHCFVYRDVLEKL